MQSLPKSLYDFDIGFYGSTLGIGTTCGYGYVAVNLIKSWQIYGKVPVWWGNNDAPISFSFTQPNYYEFDNKTRPNIGYTPWESTVLPKQWDYYMNNMTEVWTTSNACREWFLQNSIEVPVRVLHHGINRKHFPIAKRSLKNEPFTFLHIGAEAKRKGAKMVYDAFAELFGNNPKYRLILKGNPPWDTNLMNVSILRDYLTQEELTQLYLRCHAMAYPTNGEGFGLIPFQAAATGMPTAVTEWGGCLDYIDYCYPIRVKEIVEPDYEPHEGLWAKPDIESVKEFMLAVSEEPEECFEEAFCLGGSMDDYWSWKNLSNISLDWMDEILKNF